MGELGKDLVHETIGHFATIVGVGAALSGEDGEAGRDLDSGFDHLAETGALAAE